VIAPKFHQLCIAFEIFVNHMPTPYAAPAQRRLFRRIGQKDSKFTHASASLPTVNFGNENKSTPGAATTYIIKAGSQALRYLAMPGRQAA
jgi:hypothetical protein